MPNVATKKTVSARKPRISHLMLAVGLVACAVVAYVAMPLPVARVAFMGRTFAVQVAANDTVRAHGLSGVTNVAAHGGMLFVFPRDAIWRFWMRDMKEPIDIVWLNAQKQVVYTVHDAAPDSYPAVFAPPTAARYVLELPAGSATGVRYREQVSF